MKFQHLVLAVAAACGASAQAADSINLANYSVTGTYALDTFNSTSGGLSGLEASAVTYARDRGTLFFVGDELVAAAAIGVADGWSAQPGEAAFHLLIEDSAL